MQRHTDRLHRSRVKDRHGGGWRTEVMLDDASWKHKALLHCTESQTPRHLVGFTSAYFGRKGRHLLGVMLLIYTGLINISCCVQNLSGAQYIFFGSFQVSATITKAEEGGWSFVVWCIIIIFSTHPREEHGRCIRCGLEASRGKDNNKDECNLVAHRRPASSLSVSVQP